MRAPIAVLVNTAIGAMGAIAEAGLEFGDNISIVRFDNIQLSAYTVPSLTTIKLPFTEIACAAIHSLLTVRGDDQKHLRNGELLR
jgi:LacI family transcriptional regulator